MVRAGTEFVLALDAMVPRDMVPPAVKEHYLAAKRESLLLLKALLDAQLGMVDDLERPAREARGRSGAGACARSSWTDHWTGSRTNISRHSAHSRPPLPLAPPLCRRS